MTLSWAASLLPGGVPVQGYVVRRYTTLGVQATVGADCAGVVATTGCTEAVVPDGTWRYGVIARQQAWVGPQGALATVTVNGPPQLTSLQMTDIDTDGRVDRVTATFDQTLAAYTAGTAPWTLANVPSGGHPGVGQRERDRRHAGHHRGCRGAVHGRGGVHRGPRPERHGHP